jgi:Zn-dependent protease
MVVMPLLSYAVAGWMMGWASAPYDAGWARLHPRRAALMAAAGPAANFVLAAFAILGVRFLLAGGGPIGPVVQFLWVVAFLNGLLGVFNLIPLPPLDGASVVGGLGGAAIGGFMKKVRETPMIGFVGLLVAWRAFSLIAPVMARLLRSLASPGA